MSKKFPRTKVTHDLFFQQSLMQKSIALDFFKAHLPRSVQSKIDWNSLTLEPGRFVAKEYRVQYSDVLYSVRLSEELAYLYILAEHKSYGDRFLPLQLLRYMCAIWQRYIEQKRKLGKGQGCLPMIYPLTYYHGRQSPYPYSTDIRDCFADKALAKAIFDKPFPLIDMTQYSDENLLQHGRASTFELLQKHIFAKDLLEDIQELLKNKHFIALMRETSGDYSFQVLQYMIEASESTHADKFLKQLTQQLPEIGDQIMTVGQQLRQQGIEQGIERGIERGIEQGIEQGIERGIKQGRTVEAMTIARTLLNRGMSLEEVAEITHLSYEKLQRIK
ncbi:MAG: Rpn family recombination-promoting nuclease/putative transposase [Pseudomonadota bacterium]